MILVAAGIIFFADALFSSKNFYYRDILNFHYPLRKILIDSFARGEFPLWNPYIYLGQPMLANPNYMALYPTNLLHLFLPFNYAFKIHFILHPIAGGLGFYFLARRLGIQWVASLAGALSYEFSGAVLSFLNLYNIIPAVALMPWLGWAFYGALHEHRWRRTLGFGGLLALQAIAVEPLILQCDVLLVMALAAIWIWEQESRFKALRRTLGVAAVGALIAVGLAAAQIVPTLEMLPLSARGSGLDFKTASEWSMNPRDLMNTLVPNLFGYPFTIDVSNYWGEAYHESTTGYLASFFLGSVTLLLSSLSLFSTRTKLRTVMMAFFGVSIILALGKFTPVYPWLYEHVPLFNMGRYPSKFFLLTSLIVSVLAALGLEAAVSPGPGRTHPRGIDRVCIAGMFLGLCAIGLAFYWRMSRDQLESLLRTAVLPAVAQNKDLPAIAAGLGNSIRATGAFLFLSGLVVLAGRRMRRFAALGGFLAFLLALELVPPNLGLAPLISDADMDFVPEVDLYMLRHGDRNLIRAVSPNIMTPIPTGLMLRAPNRSLAWMILFYRRSGQSLAGIRNGIQYSIDKGIDHLNTRESELLLKSCVNMAPKERLALLGNLNSARIMSLGDLKDPRADLLSRFDTHSNLDYGLYSLKDALPRAYFATRVIRVASEAEALNRLAETNNNGLLGSVILESAGEPLGQAPATGGQVEIARYENNRVSCRVEAHSDGYLVLLDSYYPGWHATVDGREADILRANFAFRAVFIPAGQHTVEFRFTPRTFYAGLALTLSTGLIATFLWLGMFIRRRSSGTPTMPTR